MIALPAVLADSARRIHLILEEEYGAFIGAVCDAPIAVVSLAPDEFKRLVPVMQNGAPACPARLAARWLSSTSKNLGIAPAARALLERVSAVSTMRKNQMSIEQALLEVAAAMRELAAAYSGETPDQAATTAATTGTATPEGEKRGRGRPRKDAAAPAAPPPPPTAPAESPLGFAAPPAAPAAPSNPSPHPTYTYEQIQRRLMEVDAQKGRQACVDLLSRYGATKLPEINPSQYTPFMSEMNAILTTGHDPAAAAPPNLFG